MTKPQPAAPRGGSVFSGLMDRPYLLLVLAPLFWGGNITFARAAVGEIDPLFLSLLRWSLSLGVLLPFALPHLKADWPAIRAGWAWLTLYGVLGFAGFNMLLYLATHWTTGVNAAIEQASIPVMVMAANFLVFGVRAGGFQIVGLALTILGVVLTATHGDPRRLLALDVNVGDAMVMLACAFYALYSLTLRYRPAMHWMSFMTVTTGIAALFVLACNLTFGGGVAGLAEAAATTTGLGWLIVAYVSVFPSILSQLFYARGVELIGPNRASLFINTLPLFGAGLSVLILGERLLPFHLMAATLIVVGIVLAEYGARSRAPYP